MPDTSQPLLHVKDLRTYFRTPRGVARAVDGVTFAVRAGETLALVGESGSGKSVTALSLLQLVPEPAGWIEDGQVLFDGKDLLDCSLAEMREIRGRDVAMIFQEPMTSLNPVFTIGWQLVEAIAVHGEGIKQKAHRRAVTLLERVGLREPAQAMRQYPHELSGGMRQRVMIALALANSPKLLIADEPTTALDVTVQAQILDLIRALQRETGMAVVLITHDFGVVARMADTVAVMYAGQIVEHASAPALFQSPRHPYTRGLLASLPARALRGRDLATLAGTVPPATSWPPACRFAPRCSSCWDLCDAREPAEYGAGTGHTALCHLYGPEADR